MSGRGCASSLVRSYAACTSMEMCSIDSDQYTNVTAFYSDKKSSFAYSSQGYESYRRWESDGGH